ncbi:hypothetical protein OAD79_03520 [Flavobacteriales bacterium]|jgi:hypothetical protein|nr:hypothetical protein [Flavobacteriales bacterium]|tara:strand:+ start:341 stop:511 length:171 start_codon:yes stop_codon:yes gene_type:complete
MKDKLSFYDVKSKSKFESDEYDVREKSGRFFAVTKSQSGSHECWRVLSKADADRLK